MARRSILTAPLTCLAILTFALAAASTGCASAKDNEDRMLEKMSGEIDESDGHKTALITDDLGVDSSSPHTAKAGEPSDAKPVAPIPPPPPARPAPTPTPALPVVRLAYDGIEATDGQEEQAPRLSLTNASLPKPTAHAAPRASAAVPEDAKHAYGAALALVNDGRYAEAQGALTGFLIRWPASPDAADALYARGLCDLALGDLASAARTFEGFLARFPSNHHAHDARVELDVTRRQMADAALAPRARKEPARINVPITTPPTSPSRAVAPVDDEDDEHIVPVDEDNDHLVESGPR